MKHDELFEWIEETKEKMEYFEPNEDEEDAYGEFMKAGLSYFIHFFLQFFNLFFCS